MRFNMQRFHFNTGFRHPGETITIYITELKKLSEHCEYGETLSEMIRDRLVVGVSNDQIQRRLLSERKLTFEKAREMAIAMEAASKDVTELKSILPQPLKREPASDVHWMSQRNPGQQNVVIGSCVTIHQTCGKGVEMLPMPSYQACCPSRQRQVQKKDS